ncbi:MAG: FUSC family protein, partial [Acidimicrobiales bacterium]
MTAAVPARPWLIQLVWPQKAAIPWARAVRAGLAIAGPFGTGLLLGHGADGLLASIGSLPAALADRGGPHAMRITRMAASAVAASFGLLVGQAVIGHPWTVIVTVTLGAAVSGLVSARSAVWSLASLNFLVTLAIASADVLPHPIWKPAALALAGGAWAVLLCVPAWLAQPEQPERLAVARAVSQLADLLAGVDQPGAVTHRRALSDAMNSAEDDVSAARVRLGGNDTHPRHLLRVLQAANPVVEAAVRRLRGARPPDPATVALVRSVGAGILPGGIPVVAAGIDREPDPDLRRPLRTLAGVIDGSIDLDATGEHPLPAPRRSWLDVGRSARMATLRLTMCMAAAQLLRTYVVHPRSYWIALTVAVVMKPDFGSVFARGIQRAIGTSVGVVLGGLVLLVAGNGAWLLPFLVAFAAVLPVAIVRNYGMFVTALTPVVLIQIDALTHQRHQVVTARLLDTLVGCGVVLVGGYLLWPDTWRPRLREHYASAAGQVARYLDTALRADPGGGRSGQHPSDGGKGQHRVHPAAQRRMAYRSLA